MIAPNLFDIVDLIISQLAWAALGLIILVIVYGVERLWRDLK